MSGEEQAAAGTSKGAPIPNWGTFLRALANIREQGFDLVQIATSCPGDGFEVVTATLRKPDERGR